MKRLLGHYLPTKKEVSFPNMRLLPRLSVISRAGLTRCVADVQDSALLILGPDGQIFATPQPDPTFSGAPTQGPSVDPVRTTSTTGSEGLSITPAISTTSSSSAESSTHTAGLVTTTTITSTLFVTSCPPEAAGCLPSPSTSSTSSTDSTSNGATSLSSFTTTSVSVSQVSATTGPSTFSQPSTSRSSTGGPTTTSTTSTPGGLTVDPVQATFTTVVPFTEYQVQIVEICAATPTPCSQSRITSTAVGYRTEISCSPGACSGMMVATSLMADFAATGLCVLL
ncbi:hypothetical protein HRR86_001873 [Exophiala dermatitidis]|nr:hypothetical protein HRR86_001873 [Exophiala dermatitidis]